MRELLGEEGAAALFQALGRPPVRGLRLNSLRGELAGLASLLPWKLERVPWCPAGYVVTGEDDEALTPGLHPYQDSGVYYLQDPAAMMVAEALAPQPGELVLDLAAAPGGKSTHIAALMNGDGWLVANDVSAQRAQALAWNLERCGVTNATVTSEEPRHLAAIWPQAFDRVLLDAPCSGEGMFRKSQHAVSQWNVGLVSGSAKTQGKLLLEAAALVKPGGYLAYSTCTFAPEENEWAVAKFVRQSDFEILQLDIAGITPGEPAWVPANERVPGLAGTARVWPHLAEGEGHFVAVLRRPEGEGPHGNPPRSSARVKDEQLPAQAVAAWQQFATENLSEEGFTPTHQRAKWLYSAPDAPRTLGGVGWRRHGVQLGEVRPTRTGARLVPAHALAMALPPGVAKRAVSLSVADPRLQAYLAGEEFSSEGEAGYVRVEVDGHPLGWGRRSGGSVRSLLPSGLRRR